jgi:hypothetical protein
MHPIFKSSTVWVSISALIIFNILYYLQGFVISKFVADLTALALLTYMTSFTTPDALIAIRGGIKSANERFIVSFWLVWVLSLIHRFWILTIALVQQYRDGERPLDLVESPISGNIAILFAIAGAYGAIAPLTGPIKMARRGYITMIIAASLASIVVGIAIGVYIVNGWAN